MSGVGPGPWAGRTRGPSGSRSSTSVSTTWPIWSPAMRSPKACAARPRGHSHSAGDRTLREVLGAGLLMPEEAGRGGRRPTEERARRGPDHDTFDESLEEVQELMASADLEEDAEQI